MPIETQPGNWPSGLPIATARWPTRSDDESPSGRAGRSGRVHLDEREVGQRVDAGHGAVHDGPVLEDDVDVSASPTTWPFVDETGRIDDDTRAGATGDLELAGTLSLVSPGQTAGDLDGDDGRESLLDDGDQRLVIALRGDGAGRPGQRCGAGDGEGDDERGDAPRAKPWVWHRCSVLQPGCTNGDRDIHATRWDRTTPMRRLRTSTPYRPIGVESRCGLDEVSETELAKMRRSPAAALTPIWPLQP